MDRIPLFLLIVAGLIPVIVVVLGAAAQLRDEAVQQGWISRSGRLGWLWRMAQHANAARAHAIAQVLNFDSSTLERIRSATDSLPREARRLSEALRTRPDASFLLRLKPWIYALDEPTNYRGSRFYLDIMGATYQRRSHEPSLEQIFLAWLVRLQSGDIIRPFDAILVPKDGNPLLAERVARAAQKPLIVCKGETDRSRVDRPNVDAPHETDFEGLRAFLAAHEEVHASASRFRAIAVDDSCANGSQLVSAATRFNDLVTAEVKAYPFEPIADVVILFRVMRTGLSDGAFTNANLRLHALVAVGDEELREIHTGAVKRAAGDPSRFKADAFSCEASLRLLQ